MAADPSGVVTTVEQGRYLMPSWKGQLTPADIAAVLTYVRSAWGNSAAPVTEKQVVGVFSIALRLYVDERVAALDIAGCMPKYEHGIAF